MADALGQTGADGGETLCAWFERLRAHLYKQIALEEHDVFLGSVLEHRPTLAPQVERLKAKQHAQLRLVNGLHEELRHAVPDGRVELEHCRQRIRQLLSDLRQVAEAKAQLILSAFCCNIGGEG